jgi:NAD(P)-dependent dehydrogenase (short-subunit alcohol dehydrogenase family)
MLAATRRFSPAMPAPVQSLAEAHKQIEATLGAPTILVNAAGGNDPKVTVTAENPFENISLEALQANLDLNYIGGAFLPCPGIRSGHVQARQRQHHQHRERVGAPAAVARDELFRSEAAVMNLTKSLAREWATKGVRVNTITPGFFRRNKIASCCSTTMVHPRARTKAIWVTRR